MTESQGEKELSAEDVALLNDVRMNCGIDAADQLEEVFRAEL